MGDLVELAKKAQDKEMKELLRYAKWLQGCLDKNPEEFVVLRVPRCPFRRNSYLPCRMLVLSSIPYMKVTGCFGKPDESPGSWDGRRQRVLVPRAKVQKWADTVRAWIEERYPELVQEPEKK